MLLNAHTKGHNKLQRLIADVAHNVPFYRDYWRKAGVQPSQRNRIALAELPIVKKADFLEYDFNSLIDQRISCETLIVERTSGSSGQPFQVGLDKGIVRRRRARFFRALMSCGYIPGQRLMLVSSRHTSSIMRLARWTYSDLQVGEEHFLSEYLRVKPHVLYGPVSSLLTLTHEIARRGLASHRPKLIVTTAEQLTETNRRFLRTSLGTNIADFYGMTELGLAAWRRPEDSSYRSDKTCFIFEFIPVNYTRELEQLVVTNLTAGAMPIIRYATGDLVRRDHSNPEAPIIEFAGRELDCLKLPDGSHISPYRATMRLETIPGIEQYQVVQRSDFAVDVHVWTAVSNPTELLQRAQAEISDLLHDKLPVTAHHSRGTISPFPGKLRPVRSLIGTT